MTFLESVATCIAKCFDFAGEATRSEFWWFFVFVAVVNSCIYLASARLSGLFFLLALLPVLAVANRRLHDTNRSGWWQLAWLFPFVGWLILAIFFVQEGEAVATS
jgi:uncharacterized membrane protein YhaH (DUF805 family)